MRDSSHRNTSHLPMYKERHNPSGVATPSHQSAIALESLRSNGTYRVLKRWIPIPSANGAARDRFRGKITVTRPCLSTKIELYVVVLLLGYAGKNGFELTLKLQGVAGRVAIVAAQWLRVANLIVVIVCHQDFEIVQPCTIDVPLRNMDAACYLRVWSGGRSCGDRWSWVRR